MELYIVRAEDGQLILNRYCPEYNKELKSWCGGEPIGYFDRCVLPEITFENSPQKVALNLLPQTLKECDECLEPITYIGYQKLFNGFKVGDEVMTSKGSKGVKTTINGFVKIATGNGKEEIKARTTHGWIEIDQLVKIK